MIVRWQDLSINGRKASSATKNALWLTTLGLLASLAPSSAQMEYTVRGKPASKEVYQAVIMVNETLPLINSGRLNEAFQKLTQALKLAPDLPEAQYNLGLVLMKQGKPDKAIPQIKAVVDEGADLPNAWVTLAGIYQNEGKYEEAVAVYKDAFQRFPEKTWGAVPEIHYNYGLALGKIGLFDEALVQLKLAEPAKADMPGLWLSLGAIYQSIGKIPESIASYKEFLKRFPQNPETPRITGAVKLMEKELKIAEKEKATNPSAADDYFAAITTGGAKRWSPELMPLKVYLKPGVKVPGFKPQYDGILRQCFQEWMEASEGKLSIEYVTDPARAVIECFWTDDPSQLSNRAEGGEARLFARPDGSIAKATIAILTVPVTPLRPVTDNLVRFVSLHEIGHALGISGHSTTPGDIMFFSTTVTDDRKDLSLRDIKTIRHLYAGEKK